jgi:small conductance mechanosensitive channel
MHPFFFAARTGWLADGGFLGRVLDEWANDAQEFVHVKLPHILIIAVIAFLLSRFVHTITHHMVHVAEQHAAGAGRLAQVRTLSGVIRTTGLAVIGVIFGLQLLDAIGFNLAPLLASAGVAGIAIGLAAQNIVKDMLNGVLILIEDQFNIGDTVRLAGVSGVVEAMTLRKTSVRDADGTLYVIPNSQIGTVANLSAGYSMATVNVNVDFSANPDVVLALLKKIAMEIRLSDDFRNLFVADPQILGVDSIKGSEFVIPVQFKTLATKQYGPIREFRRRVRLAFEQNHLLPGDPNRVFLSFSGDAAASSNRPGENDRPGDENEPAHDPTKTILQDSNPFSGN